MESLVDRIRNGLSAGQYPSERAVSTSIVVPILRQLGWDDSDPSQVIPEYANPRGRVDYALSPRLGRPAVFIEVKRVGQSADADRQLFEYAFHEGAPIAVLTDGRLWNFYLPGQHGSYEDRRVYQLDLVERDTAESVKRFRRYLQKERVASGEALADAQSDYRDGTSRRAAELALPAAWAELIAEPNPILIDLLRERTEAMCGHRPSDEVIERYFRTIEKEPTGTQTPFQKHDMRVQRRTFAKAATVTTIAANREKNFWRVGEVSGCGKNGTDALQAVLSALFSAFPSMQEKMAAAVRTRTRNNIARVVDEIYPEQPELAQRNHRPLVDGWFVGTNESSATKMRIVEQAAKAVGLTMQSDVEFQL